MSTQLLLEEDLGSLHKTRLLSNKFRLSPPPARMSSTTKLADKPELVKYTAYIGQLRTQMDDIQLGILILISLPKIIIFNSNQSDLCS
ncbi:hypothetical protein V9T40_006950 [Parthenolecanium corni]|uniref:Uncharacterized protein n=1 Tax=Parthenolecanium corni TaxID=536013 RepID=A0AAN9TUE2_9HEMI